MIEPAHIDAARRKPLRLVLERRLLVLWRIIPFGVVIKLDAVAVGILAHEGLAVAEIAVGPTDVEPGALQRRRAAFQRLRRAGAKRDVTHARGLGGGELEGVALIVIPSAQID